MNYRIKTSEKQEVNVNNNNIEFILRMRIT